MTSPKQVVRTTLFILVYSSLISHYRKSLAVNRPISSLWFYCHCALLAGVNDSGIASAHRRKPFWFVSFSLLIKIAVACSIFGPWHSIVAFIYIWPIPDALVLLSISKDSLDNWGARRRHCIVTLLDLITCSIFQFFLVFISCFFVICFYITFLFSNELSAEGYRPQASALLQDSCRLFRRVYASREPVLAGHGSQMSARH